MATLYISEYSHVASVGVSYGPASAPGQAPLEPALADQALASWPEASNAFQPGTTLVRVHTDSICSIVFGQGSPSATTSNKRLAANQTEYFGVPAGANFKIAVVANT